MDGKDYWTNPPIDEELGIGQKFYPRFLAPYDSDTLHAMRKDWNLCACLCTDDKYYVINRHEYDKLTRKQFHTHRIGPFNMLDDALLVAATLDGRNI
mgnify:CR=1 FL=1